MTDETSASGLSSRPLEGVTVIEVGVWHAGPGASAILGDLGADVIKIENISGDPERYEAGSLVLGSQSVDTEDWSLIFELSNRNKRGLAIDIASEEGRSVLERIISTADVFLTNLRPSSKEKLGIDYQALSAINPRLIHVNVTGFGPNGPLADRGAYDTLGQAMSGMFYVSGHSTPQPLPVVVLDQLTAQLAAQAATTALLARERQGGGGQDVHISLYGSGALWLSAQLIAQSVLKTAPNVTYDRMRKSPLMAVYECQDGRWIVGTNPGRSLWHAFCEETGALKLKDHEWDINDRASQEAMYAVLDPLLRTRPAAEWVEVLRARGLLFAPVQDFAQVLEDPQAAENGYIVEADHPRLGQVKLPGSPMSFGKQETSRWEPAPSLGEHTDKILQELGYDSDQISRLRDRNIVA